MDAGFFATFDWDCGRYSLISKLDIKDSELVAYIKKFKFKYLTDYVNDKAKECDNIMRYTKGF